MMHGTIVEETSTVSDHLTSDAVVAYEGCFSDLAGMKQAIAFAYARTALRSILLAVGMGRGDEVILSPLTCKVVPLVLLSLDVIPVYADISADTLNLNPQCVKSAIRPATRAVLFQHTYGSSTGVEEVAKIAARQEVPMFEDCAHCLPYFIDSQSPGSWGRAAIFSNNLLKPLPAGSGGIAVTNDSELAQRIRKIRDCLPRRGKLDELILRMEILTHKRVLRPTLYWYLFELNRTLNPTYRLRSIDLEVASEVEDKGFQVSHYQMREGMRWLHKLENILAYRRLCYTHYTQALSGFKDLKIPEAGVLQPLYYFPVLVENKQELLREARKRRIEIIAWPTRTPIYPIENKQKLPDYGYEPGTCPVAEDVANKLIGLPMHCKITPEYRNRIVDLLIKKKG